MFNDISTKSMKITELLLQHGYPFHYHEESDILELGGHIDGRRYYRGSRIKNGKFPSTVYAPDGMILAWCSDDDLPEILYCGGNLSATANGCEFTKLPSVLYVNGKLDITRVPLKVLPKTLNVTNGSNIYSIADELVIPEGFLSTSSLSIKWSNVKRLPKRGIIMGDFWCKEELLETISPDFIVMGQINSTYENSHYKRYYGTNYWNQQ